MKHLTAFLLVVMLVLCPSCKYFKGKKSSGKNADTMAAWQAKQKELRSADSLKKIQEQIQARDAARLDSLRRAEEDLKARKYNIIVGSFKVPQNAKDYAEVYKQKGYNDARVIKMKDSDFELVSAEAFQSFSKAVERLAEFQGSIEVDAWMYIVK